jgi:hypothetical protein
VYDDNMPADKKCGICNGQLRFPYLHWQGATALFICGPCCVAAKKGLTADIIQLAAIVEIQQIQGHNTNTLVRKKNIDMISAAREKKKMQRERETEERAEMMTLSKLSK